jgi:uncharacterized membrane protein
MDLETSKNLGGVGAILLVIGSLAGIANTFGFVIDLVGIILLLIAFNGLAGYYNEGGIFTNAIYGIVIDIIGVIVFAFAIFLTVLSELTKIGLDLTNISNTAQFQQFFTNPANFNEILKLGALILLEWIVFIIFLSVAAVFIRRSLIKLSAKSGVGMFGTAGLLILIGAVLTVVVFGLALVWFAAILLAVAFFSIRAQPAQPATPSPPPQ